MSTLHTQPETSQRLKTIAAGYGLDAHALGSALIEDALRKLQVGNLKLGSLSGTPGVWRQITFRLPESLAVAFEDAVENNGSHWGACPWTTSVERVTPRLDSDTRRWHGIDLQVHPAVPSKRQILDQIRTKIEAGCAVRKVTISLPPPLWARVENRCETFGIMPAEYCGSCAAYHALLHEAMPPRPVTS